MTKGTLEQYRWLVKNISLLEDRLLTLETRARKVTSTLSHEPRGTGDLGDRLSASVAAIIECRDEINADLEKLHRLEQEIIRETMTLPEREKYLLRLRYLKGLPLKDVAKQMHYSVQHILRIEGQALDMLKNKDVNRC